MKNVTLVVSGIVFGGALLVATQQVYAQAQRRSQPAQQWARWEQGCEAAPTLQDANKLAATRGQQGWELVSFVNGAMCFKRPSANAARSEPTPAAIEVQPVRADDDWGY